MCASATLTPASFVILILQLRQEAENVCEMFEIRSGISEKARNSLITKILIVHKDDSRTCDKFSVIA